MAKYNREIYVEESISCCGAWELSQFSEEMGDYSRSQIEVNTKEKLYREMYEHVSEFFHHHHAINRNGEFQVVLYLAKGPKERTFEDMGLVREIRKHHKVRKMLETVNPNTGNTIVSYCFKFPMKGHKDAAK